MPQKQATMFFKSALLDLPVLSALESELAKSGAKSDVIPVSGEERFAFPLDNREPRAPLSSPPTETKAPAL